MFNTSEVSTKSGRVRRLPGFLAQNFVFNIDWRSTLSRVSVSEKKKKRKKRITAERKKKVKSQLKRKRDGDGAVQKQKTSVKRKKVLHQSTTVSISTTIAGPLSSQTNDLISNQQLSPKYSSLSLNGQNRQIDFTKPLILWVDDNPLNNDRFLMRIRNINQDIQVYQVLSTEDGIQFLKDNKHNLDQQGTPFRILTDRTRTEAKVIQLDPQAQRLIHQPQQQVVDNSFAGEEFIRWIRENGYMTDIMLFCSFYQDALYLEHQYPNVRVSRSPQEGVEFATMKPMSYFHMDSQDESQGDDDDDDDNNVNDMNPTQSLFQPLIPSNVPATQVDTHMDSDLLQKSSSLLMIGEQEKTLTIPTESKPTESISNNGENTKANDENVSKRDEGNVKSNDFFNDKPESGEENK